MADDKRPPGAPGSRRFFGEIRGQERVKKCRFVILAGSASKNLPFRASINDGCEVGIHLGSP